MSAQRASKQDARFFVINEAANLPDDSFDGGLAAEH